MVCGLAIPKPKIRDTTSCVVTIRRVKEFGKPMMPGSGIRDQGSGLRIE
jgi:hypothetical protein